MQAGREIKFQVWDQDAKKMWTWEDIIEAESAMFITLLEFLQQDQFIKRQFTGLCDKNGKEIYEGDVVRFIDVGVIGSQHYKNEGEPKGVVRWSDFGAFYLDDGDEGPFMHSMTEFEVIGNVYENPELLEVEK